MTFPFSFVLCLFFVTEDGLGLPCTSSVVASRPMTRGGGRAACMLVVSDASVVVGGVFLCVI